MFQYNFSSIGQMQTCRLDSALRPAGAVRIVSHAEGPDHAFIFRGGAVRINHGEWIDRVKFRIFLIVGASVVQKFAQGCVDIRRHDDSLLFFCLNTEAEGQFRQMLIPFPDCFQQNRFEAEAGAVFQSGFKDPADAREIRSGIAHFAELLDRVGGLHVVQSIRSLLQERDQKERDLMKPGGEEFAGELRIPGVAEVIFEQTDPFRGGGMNVCRVTSPPGLKAQIGLFLQKFARDGCRG